MSENFSNFSIVCNSLPLQNIQGTKLTSIFICNEGWLTLEGVKSQTSTRPMQGVIFEYVTHLLWKDLEKRASMR